MTSYPFQRALITGASSGIGATMAELLGAAGVPVVLVARRGDRLQALADRFNGFEVLTADLNDSDGLAAVVARVESDDNPIDLVVNNAGFGTSGMFHDIDPDRLHDEIGLNIQALTRLSHVALRVMIPRSRGYLLNVSSMASFQPAPKLAVYAATKAYVTNLTESLHEEARGTGVHVTALCPGLTKTEFQSVSNSDAYASSYPAFAWIPVEDVAGGGLADVAKGKALSIPGALYKGMSIATGITPRTITRYLSRIVQR
ncbi:MAG: SDR family oxidoreductase [Ilumatobacteraceae bacterium]